MNSGFVSESSGPFGEKVGVCVTVFTAFPAGCQASCDGAAVPEDRGVVDWLQFMGQFSDVLTSDPIGLKGL